MKTLKKILFSVVLGLVLSLGAHAQVLSDLAENKSVDVALRGQTYTWPATQYWGLTTDACTDSSNGTEPSGGAYARVSYTASLANWAGTQSTGSTTASSGTGGSTSNNNAITWTTSTASWGTLQATRMYDALTAGNMLICIPLTSSLNVSGAGVTPAFPAASISVTWQ